MRYTNRRRLYFSLSLFDDLYIADTLTLTGMFWDLL